MSLPPAQDPPNHPPSPTFTVENLSDEHEVDASLSASLDEDLDSIVPPSELVQPTPKPVYAYEPSDSEDPLLLRPARPAYPTPAKTATNSSPAKRMTATQQAWALARSSDPTDAPESITSFSDDNSKLGDNSKFDANSKLDANQHSQHKRVRFRHMFN